MILKNRKKEKMRKYITEIFKKKAKLEWKIMKYEQIENIKEKVAQKEQ